MAKARLRPNRREEISVGLIDTLTSRWRRAGLKATFELSDTIQRGMRLRVQPRGPTFFASVQDQGKEFRVRIGRIDAWGLALACAAIVRHVSTGNGIPSEEWIGLQRLGPPPSPSWKPFAPPSHTSCTRS